MEKIHFSNKYEEITNNIQIHNFITINKSNKTKSYYVNITLADLI